MSWGLCKLDIDEDYGKWCDMPHFSNIKIKAEIQTQFKKLQRQGKNNRPSDRSK